MKHPDDEHDFFNRLEAELTADFGADVVDLDKARTARTTTTDPVPDQTDDESGDPSAQRLVDGPDLAGPGYLGRLLGAKRQAIVPPWLRSTAELKTATGWVARHYSHLAGYHLLRSPVYAARLTLQSPRGAAKVVGGSARWVADREGDPVRAAAVRREDVGEYLKLSRQRDGRVRLRTIVAALSLLVGTVTAFAVYVLAPGWVQALSVSALILALGAAGRRPDAPVINRAVEVTKAPKLTSDIILRALGALGIAPISQAQSKGRDGFTFTAPITRDGPGWRAEGDLPYGVTVTDVIERRDKLASGLRRPLGCVWPEAVPDEHTGRLVLWVGDQDMSTAKKPLWPLLKSGSVDLFKPVAFGTDQRGRWVEITLMYIAAVIGAIPRMGKTFLLRLLLLIAALDTRAELHTYDLKGTGDLDPVGEKVSHRHRAGDEDADIEYALADLRDVREELRRRAKMIRSLPRDICPESKVTSELANKPKLGLHPIVIGVDECQVWFEHPKHGAEFEEICTDLVKRGPATGIVLLLATQRPDAKALPTGISANASARFCLKVMGQLENDMVLGTSSYKRGCGPRCSPGRTRASTTSSAKARTPASSPPSTWTPPPPRPSATGPAPPAKPRAPSPATRWARSPSTTNARPTTSSPTSSPSSPPRNRRSGRRPSWPVSRSCGRTSTAAGTPRAWPPPSSPTASPPARYGARPRAARAPTGAASNAPGSPPPSPNVTESGTRASHRPPLDLAAHPARSSGTASTPLHA